jgi:uncharacterized repeat protein (TIGR04138 family)
MSSEFEAIIDRIHEQDPRYKAEAYMFVMEALSFTQKKLKSSKHVTGEQILVGMKELLLERFGPMAINVLDFWGVMKTEDFGNIVFNLVDHKVLSKTEEDHIERFKNVYDFQEVFCEGYRKELLKKISRMRSI